MDGDAIRDVLSLLGAVIVLGYVVSLVFRLVTRIFANVSKRSPRLSLSSLTFDAHGWHEVERRDGFASWRHITGDVLSLARIDGGAPELRDAREIAENFEGSIVSFDSCPVDRYSATRFIYKVEAGSGYKYSGMIFLPFEGCSYVVSVVSGERGPTGVREALVTARLLEQGSLTPETYESEWFSDPYDPDYEGRVLRSLSDDESYDGLIDHPLSTVRRILGEQVSLLREAVREGEEASR